MDKMREEFQRWFYDQTGLQCKFDSYNDALVTESLKTTGDAIANTSCCIAWQSWQASRAALCVKLPENCKGMALTVDEFIAQLDTAGVGHE